MLVILLKITQHVFAILKKGLLHYELFTNQANRYPEMQ
jgi:hypothetical protein